MSDTQSTTAAPETPVTAAEEAFNIDALVGDLLGKPADAPASEETADAAAIDKAVAETIPPADGATYDDGAQRWRGADGKFLKADGSPDPDPEPPATDAVTPPTDTETKDTKAAPAKAAFTVYGKDGQPIDVSALPIDTVELTIAGKTRREPLDKVVRMAQSGGYNEQLQQEVTQAREIVPYAERLEAALKERDQLLVRILSDPNAYVSEAEAYERAHTPEAQLERARRDNEALQQQIRERESTQQVVHATETVILPKFEGLLAQYPTVTPEEMAGILEPLIRPYRAHGGEGPVPAEYLPHVVQLLDRSVAPVAHQIHEARTEANRQKAETAKQATAAQEAAQRAAKDAQAKAQSTMARQKAELSRTIAPVGRGNAVSAPKPRHANANDAAEWALKDALASIGAA